jgi:hypothetical protein
MNVAYLTNKGKYFHVWLGLPITSTVSLIALLLQKMKDSIL